MNDKTYLIKMTPASYFFFGGENTLGYGEERNYLAVSRHFPQQTTVLGMLRYLLLQENGLLNEPHTGKKLPEKAKDLIGESSFSIDNKDGYGQIKEMSPVFLMDEKGGKVLPIALNQGKKTVKTEGSLAEVGATRSTAHVLLEEEEGEWKPYDPKNELKQGLVDESGKRFYYTNGALPEEEQPENTDRQDWSKDVVFHPHDQVGIKKNLHGHTDEDGFYKQTSWLLRKGFSFACYVKTEQPSEAPVFPSFQLLTMGGERSLFRIEAELIGGDFEEFASLQLPSTALPADTLEKIVLLNDTYVPNEVYEKCAFAITQTTPFRHHISNTEKTSRYFDLDRDVKSEGKKGKLRRSHRYTLLKKGSVLYPKAGQLNSITDKLREQKAFRAIGYNYFVATGN